MTAAILYALSVTVGLWVDDDTEAQGLDGVERAVAAYHQIGLVFGPAPEGPTGSPAEPVSLPVGSTDIGRAPAREAAMVAVSGTHH